MTNAQIEALRGLLSGERGWRTRDESEAILAAISLAERVRDAPVGLFEYVTGGVSYIHWDDAPVELDGKRVALVEVE